VWSILAYEGIGEVHTAFNFWSRVNEFQTHRKLVANRPVKNVVFLEIMTSDEKVGEYYDIIVLTFSRSVTFKKSNAIAGGTATFPYHQTNSSYCRNIYI